MSSAKLAKKIARSAERRQLRNSSAKTRMKTAVTGAGSAREGVLAAISTIDGAVSKGVIHRNKGARLKSRLAKKLNQATRPRTGRKKKGG